MDNRTGEMQVFVRVAETGSFSEAARRLRMTPSTVSKLVSRIEERLGVRLVERSTRALALTAEGVAYFERSQALLAELDDIESSLGQQHGQPQGTVTVNASVAFGTMALEPILPEFWAEYPRVVVDLSLSDTIVDLYLDRTDVAFRVGKLQDSNLHARRLGQARRMIVGSPDYLTRHGTPRTVQDLDRHNCLGFNFRRAAPIWPMKEGGRVVSRTLDGSLLANNGETVRRMALAGVGLARLGSFNVTDDVAAGRLVEVLQASGVDDREDINAVYLGGTRMAPRVVAFLDFVVPRLQAFLKTRA